MINGPKTAAGDGNNKRTPPLPRYNVVDPRRINIVTGGGVRRAFIFSIAGSSFDLEVATTLRRVFAGEGLKLLDDGN